MMSDDPIVHDMIRDGLPHYGALGRLAVLCTNVFLPVLEGAYVMALILSKPIAGSRTRSTRRKSRRGLGCDELAHHF